MIHLQKFIDRVQGHEARGQKDFVMSMTDARAMHADLTRLLLELNELKQPKNTDKEEVIEVKVTGGKF